jgi:hypothetical protein
MKNINHSPALAGGARGVTETLRIIEKAKLRVSVVRAPELDFNVKLLD